jgi:glycosyltransferase involved in cell wall biosynthesis
MPDDRPDIAVLGYDLRMSGVVRNALRIAGAAANAGMRTELWVTRGDGPLRNELPPDVKLREITGGSTDRGRTIGLARSIPAFAAQLKSVRPRIALSSGNHMHLAASLAYRLAGRPAGVALWARASNATLKHPLGAYLGRPLPASLGRTIDRINRLQYSTFARIIAVSHELGRNLTGELGLPAGRVTVIPNGVALASIAQQADQPLDHPWMLDEAVPVILCVGRLSRQKNFPDLIRALPHVLKQRQARLVMLGPGNDAAVAELTSLARSLGVSDHVRVEGFDPNPFRWIARATVLAVPSLWEGSSNVVIEGLACGTPVVAYRCPTGIAEVVETSGAGRTVAPGDVTAFAGAIVETLGSPRDPQRLKNYASAFELAETLRLDGAEFRTELDRQRQEL